MSEEIVLVTPINADQGPVIRGVYGLRSPGTNAIRFVGSSSNIGLNLYARLKNRRVCVSTPCDRWIYTLHKFGKKPECVLLEEVCHGDLDGALAHWIDVLIFVGQADLNVLGTKPHRPKVKTKIMRAKVMTC